MFKEVVPLVVILAVRTGHGGKSFVGVVNSQRYRYSSSVHSQPYVHIQLRYVSLVNAIGGTFLFSENGCLSVLCGAAGLRG